MDIWTVSNHFDKLLCENKVNPSYKKFLEIYKPEIVEIICQLIHNKEDNYCYKIKNESLSTKVKKVFFVIYNKFIKYLKTKSFYTLQLDKFDYIFVVGTLSHLRQYELLQSTLDTKGLKHLVVFLDGNLKKEFSYKIVHSIDIGSLSRTSDILKTFWHVLFISLNLLIDKKLSFMFSKYFLLFRIELLLMNFNLSIDEHILKLRFNRIIKEKPETVIFFKSEGSITRSLIKLLNDLKIKTIAIQHGFIAKEIKYNNLEVGTYLTWSKKFSNSLKQSGSNCKTEAVGALQYEKYFNENIKKHENLIYNNEILFLPNSGASQTPHSELVFCTKLVLEYSKYTKFDKIFIKPHPGAGKNTILSLINENSSKRIHYIDPLEQIKFNKYKIIFTMNSTSGIDAAINRRPLVILCSNKELVLVKDYLNYNIAELASNVKNLIEKIDLIEKNYTLYQKNTDLFVDKFLVKNGSVSKSIIEKIIKLP